MSKRILYTLPDCKFCGKKSNTTDKETARDAKRFGRICRACTSNPDLHYHPEESIINAGYKWSMWKALKGVFGR